MAETWVEAACVDCGLVKMVRWNRELNQGRCRACRARAAPKEPCGECGRQMRVNARRADGAALCVTCYARTRTAADRCDGCGTVGPLAVRSGGKGGHTQDLCTRCYRHPKRPCGVCGRTRRVALRATADTPDICPTCYQAPVIDCTVCGQPGLGRRTTKNGKPWCFACQATDYIDNLLTGTDGAIPAKLKNVRDVLVARAGAPALVSNWRRTQSLRLLARLAERNQTTSPTTSWTRKATASRLTTSAPSSSQPESCPNATNRRRGSTAGRPPCSPVSRTPTSGSS